jgi:Tfp pilus assembly protein PilZ
MSSNGVGPIVGRALVVSNDSAVAKQIATGMQRFSIAVEICTDISEALNRVGRRKFEAVVVDLAFGEQVANLLDHVRLSPSNQKSVTFGIQDPYMTGAFQVQPNFLIQKPLEDRVFESTLKAALGLIIREYRRYFRCPIAVPVSIHDGALEFRCEIVNLSEGGAAVSTPITFRPGTPVRVRFTLPDEPAAFDVEAEICWSNNKGLAAVQFVSHPPGQKVRLQNWLSRQIERGLPEPTAKLFRRNQ